MVSIGLFAIVMMMASGAYFIMISANREAQATTTGINNLAYALESMTRNIRTGRNYRDCYPAGSNTFTFDNENNDTETYSQSGTKIISTKGDLTDPLVNIDSLTFYCNGIDPYSVGSDAVQANVVIVIKGTVSAGPGTSKDRKFYIETSATMRGTDL